MRSMVNVQEPNQHLLITVLELIDEEVGEAAADAGVDGAIGFHEVAHCGE